MIVEFYYIYFDNCNIIYSYIWFANSFLWFFFCFQEKLVCDFSLLQSLPIFNINGIAEVVKITGLRKV